MDGHIKIINPYTIHNPDGHSEIVNSNTYKPNGHNEIINSRTGIHWWNIEVVIPWRFVSHLRKKLASIRS